MWETIFDAALNNGLWAALFVALMVYVLRDTAKREKKYQDITQENQRIIHSLAEDLRIVNDIKEDINEIKGELMNGKVNKQKRNIKRSVDGNSVGGTVSYQHGSNIGTDVNGSDSSGLRSVDSGGGNNKAQG